MSLEIFLIVVSVLWILFGSIQDLRKKEIADWISFSLIIFALGFRFFYCLFDKSMNFNYFYQSLIGLGIFLILGYGFYYSRIFAGGDAKLFIALGAILPVNADVLFNLKLFVLFIILFMIIGAIYGLIWSFFLPFRNIKKFKIEFKKSLKNNKKMLYLFLIFALIFFIFSFKYFIAFVYGIFVLIIPLFYIYAKIVDNCCMIKKISVNKLVEGDVLYENVKIGNKILKPYWQGLDKNEIKKIAKYNKYVKIKDGIPFIPVFLFSYILFVLFYKTILLWSEFF